MKISPSQMRLIAKVYGQNRISRIGQPKKTSLGKDKVDLSAEGKEIQALRQKIAQLPEVREEKVAQLRAALQAGTYKVSAREIAEKMVDRSLTDVIINRER